MSKPICVDGTGKPREMTLEVDGERKGLIVPKPPACGSSSSPGLTVLPSLGLTLP